MGLLGPDAIVEPIEATPPLHGLLDTAREARDPAGTRWEMGFTFAPWACSNGGVWVPCQDRVDEGLGLGGSGSGSGEQTKDSGEAGDLIEFVPFVVWDERTCNTLGFRTIDYKGQAVRRLEASQHKQVEYEFWTGAQMNQAELADGSPVANMSLTNSVSLDQIVNPGTAQNPTPVSLKTSLRLLAQALANCAQGSRGMIHATPYVAEAWADEGYIKEEGGRLMTMTRGNLVVDGGGYPGTGPSVLTVDPAVADSDLVWVYATGMVEWRLSEIMTVPDENEIREALDRRINKIEYRAERFAAAVWDDCCTFAVLVDVCAGGC